jgi:L-amino acid N-acyltransferase YncA
MIVSLGSRALSEVTKPQRISDTRSVERTSECRLRNGLTVSIRTVTIEDEPSILAFLTGLSLESRCRRFFGVGVNLRAEAHRGAAGDDPDHHGMLAVAPERGVVGHAIYVRVPGSERAEVAVEVVDDLHQMGLATVLLARLAQVAEARQIRCFFAEVLPENHAMLAVFHDRFAAEAIVRRGEVDIEFPTSNWHGVEAGLKP